MTHNDKPSTPSGRPPVTTRWWLNLALLLVVATLALTVWYFPQPGTAPDTSLTSVDKNAISRIELKRANQPSLTFEKASHGWRMTTPLTARANAYAIDGVLALLRAPTEGPVENDGELNRFGLAQPLLTARYGESVVEIGARHPVKDLHYARHADTVHLIPARYFTELSRPVYSYLDPRPIPEELKPTSFKLTGFSLTLVDGQWQRQPTIGQLSSDRINTFVDHWRHARAFRLEPYARQAISERIVVTLIDANGNASTLTIGVLQRKPELLLARLDENLVYRFPQDAATDLLTLTNDTP